MPLGKRRGSGAFGSSEVASKRRRSLLALMTAQSQQLLTLMVQAASVYVQAGTQAMAEGQQAAAADSQGAVQAALEALAALAGWLPLKVLKESPVLDACVSLIQTPALQLPAIEVVLQVRLLLAVRTGHCQHHRLHFYPVRSTFVMFMATARHPDNPPAHPGLPQATAPPSTRPK